MTIEEKGIENKALIDYNAQYVSKIRELWASNPSVETFQDSLFQIYSEGMELISNRILTQVVKKYLEIKAYSHKLLVSTSISECILNTT